LSDVRRCDAEHFVEIVIQASGRCLRLINLVSKRGLGTTEYHLLWTNECREGSIMSDIFSLKHLIEESFMGSEHPGDDENDIFVVEDFDVPEFMEMIHGNDWKSFLNVLETSEFPLSQSYGGMFYYMSDKAFHYFAPAHLLFSLHENSDTLAGAFFSHLYPQPEIYASRPTL
jgi:hypothetical protein